MKPYTYLIRHIPTNRVYYGVRIANKVDPCDDLWKNYFTSSRKIKELISQYGVDSFHTEVRKVFDSKEKAIAWEVKVLRRCKVLTNENWINGNIAGYIAHTAESNKKISEFHKGKHKSESHKRKLSLSQKEKPKKSNAYKTIEFRNQISILRSGTGNGRYGKEVGSDTRKKISEANKGKTPSNKGKPMSEEQKAKIRATIAAKKI